MGSNQFQSKNKIICALCDKSDETEITGPLSSKDSISAHENCLLFASGIYCKNSPTYDDLFGFDVEDVKKELKRGKRLTCHYCKKTGATAGCEEKRCKRSYHYPCAIKDRARVLEDRFILFCELHDPESKKTNGQRPDMKRPDKRDFDSSTRSTDISLAKKKKSTISCQMSTILLDSDDESDIEERTSPNQENPPAPDPESKRPCAEPSPSATGSLKLTSAQKAYGSENKPGELRGRSKGYPYMYRARTVRPLKVRSPRSRKNTCILDSDDENSISTDRVAPGVSDPKDSMLQKQSAQSTPVPKKSRPCEKLPSTTEADNDTDIDSDESQSLLPSKQFCLTTPCSVILDSGPSAESEHSLERSSPAGEAPAAVSTTPGSVTSPEHEETPSTNRTSPPPRAPTTEPVSPGTIYSMPTLDYFSCDPSGQAGSPQHSSPTVDGPAVLKSSVKSISASHFKSGVSLSPGRPAADEGTTVKSKTSANIFWTRCNEVGWTKEIFSELVSQLSSLGERVQSQKASHQDYDVALKVLGASGWLPCIITQLEQDLEKQEQDLQRKKAALRDAKDFLDV